MNVLDERNEPGDGKQNCRSGRSRDFALEAFAGNLRWKIHRASFAAAVVPWNERRTAHSCSPLRRRRPRFGGCCSARRRDSNYLTLGGRLAGGGHPGGGAAAAERTSSVPAFRTRGGVSASRVGNLECL